MQVAGPEYYVHAPCQGLFEPAFELGDEVEAGQTAGYDPLRRRPRDGAGRGALRGRRHGDLQAPDPAGRARRLPGPSGDRLCRLAVPAAQQRAVALILCAAQVLAMAGTMTFQALIPTFIAEWRLSHAEAGWISGAAYAGYMAGVPLLVTLTDRIDARRMVIAFALVASLSSLGFALLAEGLWSALLFRVLNGLALAGTYMPGLKALTDRVAGPRASRYQSLYTATFSVGTGLSLLQAGLVGDWLGWRPPSPAPASRRCSPRCWSPGACRRWRRRAPRHGRGAPVRRPPGAAQPRGDGLRAGLRRPHLGAVRLPHLARRLHGVRRRRPGRRRQRRHDQHLGDRDPDCSACRPASRQRARQPLRPAPDADPLHAAGSAAFAASLGFGAALPFWLDGRSAGALQRHRDDRQRLAHRRRGQRRRRRAPRHHHGGPQHGRLAHRLPQPARLRPRPRPLPAAARPCSPGSPASRRSAPASRSARWRSPGWSPPIAAPPPRAGSGSVRSSARLEPTDGRSPSEAPRPTGALPHAAAPISRSQASALQPAQDLRWKPAVDMRKSAARHPGMRSQDAPGGAVPRLRGGRRP